MEKAVFEINGRQHQVSVTGSPEFRYGPEVFLSDKDNDISYGQEWYQQGFKALPFLTKEEFSSLHEGLVSSIGKIVAEETGAGIEGFRLDNYHHFVKKDEDHFRIVSRTRDLFSDDFTFPVMEMLPKFEQFLGFGLTDIDPLTGKKLHIIVRINRPGSTDYNPPHKDIYQGVDNDSYIPKFINLWIPVCGVTENSSLPVVPSSHLIPENKILRTFEGGVLSGNTYRVRMIREWGGSNRLERAVVNYGEVLFFSSHLVHGLAINEEKDKTRVALEFRLFKRD